MEARVGIGDRALAVAAAVVFLSLALLASSGCSETGCSESRKLVTISGSVTDDGFVSGDILLDLAEGESERCTPGALYSTGTPGDTIQQAVLPGPGTYSISGEVRWVAHRPDLDLILWSRTSDGVCRAGALVTLPAEDAPNIDIVAVAGSCPRRL
jgi:hypothetical protein